MTIDIGPVLAKAIEHAVAAWAIVRVVYLLFEGRWK